MSHKYQVGERVRIKDTPYRGTLQNGKLGTVTKVTVLGGETHAMHVLMDDIDQRSRNLGGAWCLYPHEIELAPQVNHDVVVPKGVSRKARAASCGTLAGKAPSIDNLPRAKKKRSKWETPGNWNITSYRSFRRYKAAGAAFGVIAFNPTTWLPEETPVNVSVRVARRRAQQGLALVAIVSEVTA